jgi:hypothetical protein
MGEALLFGMPIDYMILRDPTVESHRQDAMATYYEYR